MGFVVAERKYIWQELIGSDTVSYGLDVLKRDYLERRIPSSRNTDIRFFSCLFITMRISPNFKKSNISSMPSNVVCNTAFVLLSSAWAIIFDFLICVYNTTQNCSLMQFISFCKQQSIRLIYFVSNSYQRHFFATRLSHKSLWYDVQSFKNLSLPMRAKTGSNTMWDKWKRPRKRSKSMSPLRLLHSEPGITRYILKIIYILCDNTPPGQNLARPMLIICVM